MAYLVLAVRRYNLRNEQTGDVVKGTTIFYTDEPIKNEGLNGILPMKINGSYEDFEKFDSLPGFYEMEFRQKPGPDGKPRLEYKDSSVIENLVFNPDLFA